jgi:hypothetical protein
MKWVNYIRDRHEIIYKAGLFIACALIIVYFFPKQASFKYQFQKGQFWAYEDLIAPYDFPVFPTKGELEKKMDKIKDQKKLHFILDEQRVKVQKDRYEQLVNKEWNSFFENYKKSGGLLSRLRKTSESETKKNVINKGFSLLDRLYNKGIIELSSYTDGLTSGEDFYVKKNNFSASYTMKDVHTVKSAYKEIESQLNKKDFLENFVLEQLEDVLNDNSANIKYSDEETEAAINKALKNAETRVSKVTKGQSIIQRGDQIDQDKYRILRSFEKRYKQENLAQNKQMTIAFGQFLLVAILLAALSMYIYLFRKPIFEESKKLLYILMIITLSVVASSIIIQSNLISVYIFPFCLVPVIVRAFFDTRTAFYTHLIIILLLGFIVPNSFNFVFMQLVAGMIGVYGFVNFKNRSQLFSTSITILASYLVSHLALGIIAEGDFSKIDWYNFGWLTISAGLTLLAYPLIYLSEKTFGFVSDVTLLELSDTNNKLLRELSKKAPGTFQHSLQVANLAEEAIFKVGGNTLLIRTAALYHDIGKMEAPMYFIENQHTGVNPHDELSYEESAQIIIDHVINGVEIAKKNGLPELIIDFIRTHHGTTKTGYFFKMYMEENPEDFGAETLFQYPGPIPFSKESAVLMMADSVEAASRSIKEPNAEKIDKLVEGIINRQMDEQQFLNANITFKEITQIKKIFKRMLMNIYHVRIEYPR